MASSAPRGPPPPPHHSQQHPPPPPLYHHGAPASSSSSPSTNTAPHYPPPPHHHHHHHAPPPPQPPPVDSKPPTNSYPQTSYPPPVQHQYPSPAHYHYPGGPHSAPPGPAPTLPPIQQPQHPYPPPQEQQPHYRDAREAADGKPQQPNHRPHSSSGHATPAPVNRTHSVDSSAQQRTPNGTQGPSARYLPASADGGAPQQHPPMDHGHYGAPPPNGVTHHGHYGPPHTPAGPPPHHEQYMGPAPMDPNYPHGPPGYGQPSYAPPNTAYLNNSNTRKKHMRATQACDQCRQRKQKCDEGHPCSFCKEQSLDCRYRDTPPAKTDKNMDKLLSHIKDMHSDLSSLTSKFEGFDRRLRGLEGTSRQGSRDAAHPTEQSSASQDQSQQDTTPQPSPDDAIPVDDHRTAPHKLISLWRTVRQIIPPGYSADYVMEAEDRGLLRLYSTDEGIDDTDGTQAGSAASPAHSEEVGGERNSHSPPHGVWGYGFPSTPSNETRREATAGWSGMKSDNTLDLDVNTINALFEKYMKHIYVMHPFLDAGRTRRLFDDFIAEHGTGTGVNTPRLAPHFVTDDSRPAKRQRSSISTSHGVQSEYGGLVDEQRIEHRPGNAIVLLVLALGKICSHTEPLPSIVKSGSQSTNALAAHKGVVYAAGTPGGPSTSSPSSGPIKQSPGSPPSTTPGGTTAPTPPIDPRYSSSSRSRRPSADASTPYPPGTRNIDVIPGLAYFARASQILGSHTDGTDLNHAQMFLLAGLYKGQLARVKESMNWYSMAGRALLYQLDRYKLYNENYWLKPTYGNPEVLQRRIHEKEERVRKDKRLNLILFAAWSCLQLEGDILAELKFPSSNIQSKEDIMLWPSGVRQDEEYNAPSTQTTYTELEILFSYQAQMDLRKRLNATHRQLYGPEFVNMPIGELKGMLDYENVLKDWRKTLPEMFQWNDDDEPPTDILRARIRGKYWGLRYIINRPFLDYLLHIRPQLAEHPTWDVENAAVDAYGHKRDLADIKIFKAIKLYSDGEITRAAQRCIDAAMHSTVAFDNVNVPDRLIMTNIHGTAHAQFGNMLVLSAAYVSNVGRALVPRERLAKLFERTIKFLRRLAPISKTCDHDSRILESVSREVLGVPHEHKHLYRSEAVEPRDIRTDLPRDANTSFGAHSVSSAHST